MCFLFCVTSFRGPFEPRKHIEVRCLFVIGECAAPRVSSARAARSCCCHGNVFSQEQYKRVGIRVGGMQKAEDVKASCLVAGKNGLLSFE